MVSVNAVPPAAVEDGDSNEIDGVGRMVNVCDSELTPPTCTVIVAVPGVASSAAGTVATIPVVVGVPEIARLVTMFPRVQRTVGLPPSVKFPPKIETCKSGAPAKSTDGVKNSINGAGAMVKVALGESVDPVRTNTAAAPALASRLAGTVTDIDVEVGVAVFDKATGDPPGATKNAVGVPAAVKFAPVITSGLIWAEPATASVGARLVIAGPDPILKFAAAEIADPVWTVTVATPLAVSSVVGTTALIDPIEGVAFKVSTVALPPGGVKRTTGVPPVFKLVPLRMRVKVGAFCSAEGGLRLEITGSTTEMVTGLESAPPATTRTVAVPTLASSAAPTVNVATPAVGKESVKSEVGPGEGEIQRPTPVLAPTLKVPERVTSAEVAPFKTVAGLVRVIEGAATAMLSVAGGATPVVTVKTPLPVLASCAAERFTVIEVAELEAGVSVCAEPPGGVKVIEVRGDRFVPLSVTVVAVFCARFEGLDEVNAGADAVIAKFEEFDVAVPVVTKICALPTEVSKEAGTVTTIEVAVGVPTTVKPVTGDPPGPVHVAVGVPPSVKPVPAIVTFKVAPFCTAVGGVSDEMTGPFIGIVAGSEDAVPEITRIEAFPAAASNGEGTVAVRVVAEELDGVKLVAAPPGGVNSNTGVPPMLKSVPFTVRVDAAAPLRKLAGAVVEMTGRVMVMLALAVPPAVDTEKVPVPKLVNSVPGTETEKEEPEGVGETRTDNVVAEPPGGVKVTVCDPGKKLDPEIANVRVGDPTATEGGVIEEIPGGGWVMGKFAVLEFTAVVNGMFNCTDAAPVDVNSVAGTVTITAVSLEDVGVRLCKGPPGGVKRTCDDKAPNPAPGKLPFKVRDVAPEPATIVGGFRLEIEGLTTSNCRSCVLTGTKDSALALITTYT
jgi:hypothetical protein